jgi:hypothetical protein
VLAEAPLDLHNVGFIGAPPVAPKMQGQTQLAHLRPSVTHKYLS